MTATMELPTEVQDAGASAAPPTAAPPWTLRRGATLTRAGVSFSVWAPRAREVSVVVVRGDRRTEHPLERRTGERGVFAADVPGVQAGDRYGFRLDGADPLPDPVSRSQPDGVHGLSEVVDPFAFAWHDERWTGIALPDFVIYELHVGTFTPEGTFAAAAARLPELLALGVTAIELMPVAEFPGRRNWGYDGVDLFAPSRSYGTPYDLRRLVDEAHRLGLAVFL
jgi:maltooligosyltrehalose trehalohydrolase